MSTLKASPRHGLGDRFTPLYIRIQDRIRAAIADGGMAAGDRIWSEAELAREYGTTRSTVRHALDQLVFEGLIVRHIGRGSFVAERAVVHSPIDSRYSLSFEEQVAQAGRVVTYRSPTLELVSPPKAIAEKLGIPPGTQVFKLERLRIIENRPVCLEIRYMPRAVGERVTGEMLASRSAHNFVGEIVGERIPTIMVSVTAEVATAAVAKKLELSEGAPLIVRTNAHYTGDGTVVICGRSIFAGDVSTDYVLGQLPPGHAR
ncbi:GntR family transcriptional regulator [Chelatococcus sp. GCM10030263]|uniref:GntR family transcriptional regulator n=1 Tax=Chelatococcus sp. GCM10030263 TaxID=3273387 RepID=UPI0036233C26